MRVADVLAQVRELVEVARQNRGVCVGLGLGGEPATRQHKALADAVERLEMLVHMSLSPNTLKQSVDVETSEVLLQVWEEQNQERFQS